jgi:hypothetical protein
MDGWIDACCCSVSEGEGTFAQLQLTYRFGEPHDISVRLCPINHEDDAGIPVSQLHTLGNIISFDWHACYSYDKHSGHCVILP